MNNDEPAHGPGSRVPPPDLGSRPVTDADILTVLGKPDASWQAEVLGERLGLDAATLPIRLASLLSLGLVEEGPGGAYRLTETGQAHRRRAAGNSAAE